MQTMVDWMKTALKEAQANLTVAQSWAKSQVDRSRHHETFKVGDEVVLSMRKICMNWHLLWRASKSLNWYTRPCSYLVWKLRIRLQKYRIVHT